MPHPMCSPLHIVVQNSLSNKSLAPPNTHTHPITINPHKYPYTPDSLTSKQMIVLHKYSHKRLQKPHTKTDPIKNLIQKIWGTASKGQQSDDFKIRVFQNRIDFPASDKLSARQGLDHHSSLALIADQKSARHEDRFQGRNNSVEAARRAGLLSESDNAQVVSLAVLNHSQELACERDFLQVEI